MADLSAGIGPFLGVFLLAHGWSSGRIGTVMTLGGIAGTVMTAPAGALIDHTKRKRLYVVVPGLLTVAASLFVLVSQRFALVAASQIATATAGAALMPALTGITLGIFRQRKFPRQNGRNQAFNHAGNTFGAAVSGLIGWKLGLPAVFWLSAVFGVLTVASVLAIPAKSIDDAAARGLEGKDDGQAASGVRVLFDSKLLLVLAAALLFFHLGNAAMLPLFGMGAVGARQGDPAKLVALTIVVAQATMIVASVAATKVAGKNTGLSGYWLILLVSFVALPIRGLVAARFLTSGGVYPVQILDGVGAGLQSVAVPGLVARVLAGTGRVNVGQGAVMTVQGIGAALSPALGGWCAEGFGYPPAFVVLGSFAIVSVVLWIVVARKLTIAKSDRDEVRAYRRTIDRCAGNHV